MDLRVQLIQEYKDGQSITELAGIYDLSRKTIYKWLARHQAEGSAGLADRIRAALHSPHKLMKKRSNPGTWVTDGPPCPTDSGI